MHYKPVQILDKTAKFFLLLPFPENLCLRSCLERKISCKYAAQSWASSFQGVLWECWKTEILSLDAQQSASAGKVWIRCQRWPAHCVIKPINFVVLLSKRNFDCSRCVGTEGIPCRNVICSCCDLKRVASLHWGVTETPESVWFYLSDQ